jgi:hypothetical protein
VGVKPLTQNGKIESRETVTETNLQRVFHGFGQLIPETTRINSLATTPQTFVFRSSVSNSKSQVGSPSLPRIVIFKSAGNWMIACNQLRN